MIKERPILFTGPMVRAILEGRKTQTRRVVKDHNMLGRPVEWCAAARSEEPGFKHIVGDYRRFCPYNVPGQRLWVKEAWRPWGWHDDNPMIVQFSSDMQTHECNLDLDQYDKYDDWVERVSMSATDECAAASCEQNELGYTWNSDTDCPIKWRPSIFLPRWASRITLEVVSVRVERLQEISEADARAEGCVASTGRKVQSCVEAYAELWNTINGPGSWEANPWVWRIEFKRLEQPHD